MKLPIIAIGIVFFAMPALGQTIKPEDASAHVGENVTVEGVVSEVHVSQRSETTFIDLGGEYPDNAFTGVIFSGDESKFSDVEDLNGKTVRITGKIDLYKGKPEIILHSVDQIKTE